MNRKEFVVVLVLTFIVIIIWIITDIIHTRPSVEVDPKVQNIIEPISPDFDQETLKQISSP